MSNQPPRPGDAQPPVLDHDLEACALEENVALLLAHAAADLLGRYPGVFSTETVTGLLDDSYRQLAATAHIHAHLPLLASRFTEQRLHSIATNQGIHMPQIPEVLFVCVHNAGRSQMAAALLDHHANGSVQVRSAGSTPAAEINPAVVGAMAEIGIDISHEFPKPLTTEGVQSADVVITMGCGDACPVFPGKRYLDWDLEDPAGKTVEQIRPIRDDIDTRVRQLLTELASAATR